MKNNQILQSDQECGSPGLKSNFTDENPKSATSNLKNNIEIPVLDFDKMQQKNKNGKDSEQKVFLDQSLFKVLKRDNKPKTQWPNEQTKIGPVTGNLIRNKVMRAPNDKRKPQPTILQNKLVKQQNYHLNKAYESEQIQNKI